MEYIRSLSYKKGLDSELAEELGVSRRLIQGVRVGKKWLKSEPYVHDYAFGLAHVVEVEFAGCMQTWGIQVAVDSSHVTAGVVTHNTGRTSARDPAIQTLPKHSKWAKKLRKAYIAPPGHVILNVDFSQGELRICAVLANEPTMIKAYQAGIDLHAMTAAQLSGYEYNEFMALPEDVRDELRFGGKAGNFGLIYGMQHKGFREYAYTTYGVSMTDEEAYIKREKFFELYSRLLAWHETYKQYAHQYQMVRSPLGRIRHLPLIASKDNDMVSQAERQAINCLSDDTQMLTVRGWCNVDDLVVGELVS